MTPAQFGANATGINRLLIALLSSSAIIMGGAIATSYAQTPPQTQPPSGEQVSESPASDAEDAPILSSLKLTGLRFSASGEISETYTTNTFGLDSSGYDSETDFITTATLNLGAHDHSRAFDGDLEYSLSGYLYADHSSSNTLVNRLTASFNAELFPEHLFLNGSAFAEPILINNLGAVGAGNRPVASGPNSGTWDTYGYTISPDFTFRLGDFAKSDTTFTQSSVFFVEPGGASISQTIPGTPDAPSQTVTYGVTEQISSGPDFYRFNWVLTGAADKQTQNGGDFTQATGVIDLKYGVSRTVALIGRFGYESYSSEQVFSQSVSGPVVMGGLQLTFGEDLQMSATAGWQFQDQSYSGEIQYHISAFSSLTGSYSDTIETPVGRLIGNLGSLGTNGTGNFYNTDYQVNPAAPPSTISPVNSFNPVPVDGIGFSTAVTRFRSASLSLIHSEERTDYRLTGFRTDYDALTELSNAQSGSSTGGEAVISRAITPELSGDLNFGYSFEDFSPESYSLLRAGADMTYTMTPEMQVYLTAYYLYRNSNSALSTVSPLSGNVSDASITIGLRRQF